MDNELDIHQAFNSQFQTDPGRVVHDGVHFPGAKVQTWVDSH